VFLTEEIFKRLSPGYPAKELQLIDMTIKMFTEPKLVLDPKMLMVAKLDENTKLADALFKAKAKEEDLASNERFATLLRNYGIEPPMKVSKQTGQPALALAKSDAHFQQLLNGDNEEVALLCEARLRVKSTQARTRTQRFLDIASRGALPIPLNYYAAATGRWGGTQGINLQNMKRGSPLRKSIMAPKGQVVVVGDLSQIELRCGAWLADYKDMLSILQSGDDPYALFGRTMFNKPDLTKTSSPLLRQSAKSASLGCIYGLGFSNMAAQLLVGFLGAPPVRYRREDAKVLGVTQAAAEKFTENPNNLQRMQDIPHTCSEQELFIHCLATKTIVDKYRAAASPIVDLWNLLTELIRRSLLEGKEYNYKDVLLFRKNEIVLANGMSIKYPGLCWEKDEEGKMQYTYSAGNRKEKLYAGRCFNNVNQATARIVMSEGMLRIAKRYQVLLTVHDECAIMVPESEAEEATAWVKAQMVQTPTWMPGIPLDAEVGYSQRYGDAKS
jgi:DNA polymerase